MTASTVTARGGASMDASADGGRVIEYYDAPVRWFTIASVGWGIVGMLVGVAVALQLAAYQANVHPMLSFGRLRPLHTNAVIFAFVGNSLFAGIYYSTQRLLKTRLASETMTKIHFCGWQAIIVAAAITLPLGFTQGKEYAELEWPIDVAIALIWVVFAINFFWTLARRAEKHLYVAIWFYIATIVTVAVLHIVNSLDIPVSAFKSYSVYGGAKDALVQWWYGHNAVAFFLTTPVLGLMYYFLPKAADRPVYSYRLSIIHFWALIFVYIWAGPHHLLNSALPEWAQTLGMIFSVMLWAPSWGGMLNGLLTLRGAWDKLKTDPVLKFLAAGVTFYGMATFEGPLLSIRSVNGLAHYTDWIIGHVHAGTLGWNGFMAAGMFYYLVPRLYGKKLHSTKLADLHFYLGTLGILLYVVAMWVSGITQGLMWRQTNADGSLVYPNFTETLLAIKPMYWMRLVGGSIYLVGFVMMAYNLARTAWRATPVTVTARVPIVVREKQAPWGDVIFGRPVVVVTASCVVVGASAFFGQAMSLATILLGAVVAVLGTLAYQATRDPGRPSWHRLVEGRALIFTVLAAVAVLVGGVAELVPVVVVSAPITQGGQHPYRALELEGRDVFIKEGCFNCHSQMIRPFAFETARYGEVSSLGDSQYDHPFQWGSKRTGPDLAREGGKYPNLWHYKHFVNPRDVSPGSNMPPYAHFTEIAVALSKTADKMHAMQVIGVPYTAAEVAGAEKDARAQAREIVKDLESEGVKVAPNSEMVAVIAYIQSIGRKPETAPAGPAVAVSP
jgi:cytochrome c oxidase cbb3-type subunit I/II